LSIDSNGRNLTVIEVILPLVAYYDNSVKYDVLGRVAIGNVDLELPTQFMRYGFSSGTTCPEIELE